jgi:hypothetical protein
MKFPKVHFVFAVALAMTFGCKKPNSYPDEPAIKLSSITVIKNPANGLDSIARVVISFTDGDGDLGTEQYDGPDNFIVNLFEKNNGTWVAILPSLSGHLPYLTPSGSNTALKGDIEHDIGLPFGLVNDTLRFDIFIYDRALHQSNTVTTPEIVVTTN